MNKKIIAAAVAAAFVAAAPAAQAEIKAYSMVQFELTDFDRDGSASDNLAVTDNQRGRFGFKGGHDLGGGLKSFAMVEFDFEGGNRDAEFGGTGNGTRIREANAGLKGAFGSIALGTVKSAYKYTGGVKYDPYVATQLEQRGRGGMSSGTTGHNAFLNNAFQYNIKAGMAKIHATYSLDDTDRDSGTENNDDGELSLGVAFGNKKWEAGAAYYDQGLSVDAEGVEALKIFGKISFAGMHTILAQFENVEEAGTAESDYIMIGYQLKLGKGMISLYYGERDRNTANDQENITLGYTHKFNKKSRVWAGYQAYDEAGGSTNDVDRLSLGIRVDI